MVPMTQQQGEPSGRGWDLTIDGLPVRVELVPYAGRLWGAPSAFRLGTVEQKLTWPPSVSRWQRTRAPKIGSIDAEDHRFGMTLRTITPSYRVAVHRNVGSLKRSGPLSFLGSLVGGTGLGGGAAAASQTSLSWLIYELDVDGVSAGSWVAKAVDGRPEKWAFVAPGGSLPDRDSRDW
jgi:hypothetical protein